MLNKLLLVLAQIETDNTSEDLLNEIHHVICSLYRATEITEKYIAI